MKKYIFYSILAITTLFVSSCSNDDILIETSNNINDVNVTVSLANFFSSYNFYDTKHDIDISDTYRTFHSESNKYIQARTLFYNSNGELVDSILTYSANTNTVTGSIKLAEGKYTVITTLAFADKSNEKYHAWWTLCDKEKLTTAHIESYSRTATSITWSSSKWDIMSYASREISVSNGATTNVSISPSPVGAIGYLYLQNFWCTSEANYPNVSDNGIRALCLFGRNIATGYKLDPKASEKYIYLDETESNSWYFLSNYLEPSDFNEDWTFFKNNLYSYFYILAPNPRVYFGYVPEGKNSFTGYGEASYNITSGQVYLAYWDYFQIGNPYFGIANNNHWNSYSSEVKAWGGAADVKEECVSPLRPNTLNN